MPCNVVRPQLALLGKDHITQIFRDFYVYQTNGTAPLSLLDALRQVICLPADSAQDCVEGLASSIHELTGGVPGHVEQAIAGAWRFRY